MTKPFVRDEDSTKLPMKYIVIIGLCAFLDFFCMNQIMPNVQFMISDFFPDVYVYNCVPCSLTQLKLVIILDILHHVTISVVSLVTYSGVGFLILMGGSPPLWLVCLVNITHSILLLGTAIFCQLFGLSPTYTWAIVFRTCWGLMNSTVGVVKTYIGEICNAHTLATGMSIISSAGGLARL